MEATASVQFSTLYLRFDKHKSRTIRKILIHFVPSDCKRVYEDRRDFPLKHKWQSVTCVRHGTALEKMSRIISVRSRA